MHESHVCKLLHVKFSFKITDVSFNSGTYLIVHDI